MVTGWWAIFWIKTIAHSVMGQVRKIMKTKMKRRMKRVQKVVDGKMHIDELTTKELKIMYAAITKASMERAIEERKFLKPEQLH